MPGCYDADWLAAHHPCRAVMMWVGLCSSALWRCRRSFWGRSTQTLSPSETCWRARMTSVAWRPRLAASSQVAKQWLMAEQPMVQFGLYG